MTVARLYVAAAVAEIRKRLNITQVSLARLCGVHPMTVSRWERNDLQVGPWHRQLLLALVSAQPRDNLEQRLSDANSNPVLILAHLLSDSISPNASQHLPFVPPSPPPLRFGYPLPDKPQQPLPDKPQQPLPADYLA